MRGRQDGEPTGVLVAPDRDRAERAELVARHLRDGVAGEDTGAVELAAAQDHPGEAEVVLHR